MAQTAEKRYLFNVFDQIGQQKYSHQNRGNYGRESQEFFLNVNIQGERD
jgi:hypothetical protein